MYEICKFTGFDKALKKYLEKIYQKSRDSYYELLKNDLKQNKKRFVITVNPEILVMAQKDNSLDGMLLDEETSLVPDGIAVVKACRKLKLPVTERITGVEIADFLLREANENGYSVYLLGAKKEVVSALAQKIEKDYPNAVLMGFTDGYVEDKDAVFGEIKAKKPDICLVALGVPAQERLIAKHISDFDKGIFVGVGGSFDVLSGSKARAPEFFIKHNIEWLYRIAKEPKRLKRFYNNNVKFLFSIKKTK